MFIWNLFSGIILGCMVCRGIQGEVEGNNRYTHGRRVIDTNHGKVQGLLVSFPNKKIKPVEVYLGLQYASLLGSRLRFMPPTNPVEKWKGLRLAMKHRAACPQRRVDKEELRKTKPEAVADFLSNIASFTRHQTEDCLSLNIYVPTKEENDTTLFSVMVFIHGESYESGTGNAYDGSVLSSFGRVIVITLNYRLGVLGYLTAGENTNIASGNYALLDIIAALHWVKENIANFTGDPGKVTLFGHGYGAALVNLLLVSPLTKDGKLFQRGIVQSGSALSSWAVAKEPVQCTRMLAESVNCSQHMSNAQSLVSCLRKLSTDDLMKVVPNSPKYFNCFAPSVSTRSSVIPYPVEILHQSADSVFGKGSLMFGLTKNEAVDYLTQDEIVDGLSALRKAQIIRTYVHNTFQYHRQKVYEILDHHYTEWDRNINNRSRRDAVMELLTDGQYVAPLIKVANYHESHGNTYFYSFTYSTRSESYPRLSGGIHGDELPYVFGAPLVEKLAPFQISEYSKAERMLSEAVMIYWTNFAKSGDPNSPVKQKRTHTGRSHSRFVDLDWLNYDERNQTYIQITMRPKLGSHYRGRQLALWLDLIPKIHKSDGADPKEHLLKDYHNMTTFDNPERLLHIDSLFPPPTTTTDRSMQTMATERNDGTTYMLDGKRWPQSGITHQNYEQEVTVAPPEQQPVDGQNITSAGGIVMGDHSVQVSITIAVGCSLLFLNILIFAGIYYQRERIKKLKKPNGEPEGLRLNRKSEEENSRSNGPETISLLSTPIAQSPQVSHVKADPDCCPPQSSFKTPSSSTYVPLHKLPSFSSSQPKGPHVNMNQGPHVNTGLGPQGNMGPGPHGNMGPGHHGNMGPGPYGNMGPGPRSNMSPSSQVINQLQSNHRLGQVSVHHGKPLDHIESNSEVTIV